MKDAQETDAHAQAEAEAEAQAGESGKFGAVFAVSPASSASLLLPPAAFPSEPHCISHIKNCLN